MIKKLLIGLLLLVILAICVFFAPAFLKPTLTHENTVTINKPRKEVWKKFNNPENMEKWLEGFKSIETLSGEPGAVGSKYKITIEEEGQTFEAVETVKEVVENEKFAFELSGDMIKDDVVVTLVDKGLTTEFTQSETITGGGIFFKAIFYWMQSTMSEKSLKNINNLKKFVEES